MKLWCKRALTLFLCMTMLCGAAVLPSYAAGSDELDEPPSALMRIAYGAADAAVRSIAWVIGSLIPDAGTPRKFALGGPDFYPGMDTFLDAPATGAKWSLGYASATLIPEGLFDPETKEYIGPDDVFMGGGLLIGERKTPTKLLDDQRVRVTAMSDGSGRGTAVFASIDGYALTSYDVRIIRTLLQDFAKDKNVVSINIGVLHQHSAIDILGMNGPLLLALLVNPWINLLPGNFIEPYSGRNTAFMENLHKVTVKAIKEAVNGMEEGDLYYGDYEAEPYIYDKRAPNVIDSKLRRFRFVPDKTGVKETWLVNYAAHCVGMGAGTRELTGDYPYFMDRHVQEKYGANFQMIQGAQLAITTERKPFEQEWMNGYERVEAYGRGLIEKLATIDDAKVPALLNVHSVEFTMDCDNPLHMLLFRSGMLKSSGYKTNLIGYRMSLVTETGYMEIGNDLAMVFGPGELDPILLYGGALGADQAWTGKDFIFTPMKDMVRGNRELLTFGIMNDHSGYYLVPNDVHNFILFGNEEINTVNVNAGAKLLDAFKAVTDWAKK